jgi:phosphatase NudJ
MARKPIQTAFYTLVVVRSGDRFLLVQECKHNQQWYFPAGRVEPGETFVEAARREALEEAGIPIIIDGILRMEHTPLGNNARVRMIFVARPEDDTPPKTVPDNQSLGASWFSWKDLEKLSLRSPHVKEILNYLAHGGRIYPLNLISFEGAPYKI